MYFQDLTPYEYFKGGSPEFNVGWLDSGHSFFRGSVPEGFISRLRALAHNPVNQTRGFHVCQFCDIHPITSESALSSAEIRVVASNGKVYASPMLICHYIEAHSYRPPQEFIDAVMQMEL